MNHPNKKPSRKKLKQPLPNDLLLQQHRLKSPRRRKRLARLQRERDFRALLRERDELYARQRALGWVPLHPPIVRGWKRQFVLREDVARSQHAAFYEALLEKLNTVQLSHRKDFRKKARRFGKKVYIRREQYLQQPDEWQWQKWNPDERTRRLFERHEAPDERTSRVRTTYIFLEPWRYALKVMPNLITQVRERDEALQARIRAIDEFFETRGLREVANRAVYGSARTRWYGCGQTVKPKHRWL